MAIEPEWHLNSVVKHVKFSAGTSSVTSAGDAFTVCSLQFACQSQITKMFVTVIPNPNPIPIPNLNPNAFRSQPGRGRVVPLLSVSSSLPL